MNENEKYQISLLQSKFQPLTAWEYFGYSILFSIPFIGTIVLIIVAIGNENINLRSYARSYFCGIILVLILFVIFWATGVFALLASITI
jgi:hypothetical protein